MRLSSVLFALTYYDERAALILQPPDPITDRSCLMDSEQAHRQALLTRYKQDLRRGTHSFVVGALAPSCPAGRFPV